MSMSLVRTPMWNGCRAVCLSAALLLCSVSVGSADDPPTPPITGQEPVATPPEGGDIQERGVPQKFPPSMTAPPPPSGMAPPPPTGMAPPPDTVLGNTCGNAGAAPQIFGSTVVSPPRLDDSGNAPPYWRPTNGRLSRSRIEYVSVDALSGIRLELITDQCTFIKGVQFGSRVLSTVANYTYGYWHQMMDSSTQPSDPTRHGYDVWVFFPPQLDGSTDYVTITVGRTAGAGTATYSFPVVRVKTVEVMNVNGAVGISRAELFNTFGKSLYSKFNGATNRAVIDTKFGKFTIYGYDPSTTQLSVDPLGVSFGFRFKIAIPCNPTVYASGTFRLLADPAKGFSVKWVNAAHGTLYWPPGCKIQQNLSAVNLMISVLLDGLIEGPVGSNVKSSIEETVKKSLPEPNVFLHGSTTRKNELLVNLQLPVPSITIQVPYDAFDMNRSGMVFGNDEVLTLLASGQGMNDYVAQVTPQTTLWSGPNGVPLSGTTSLPYSLTVSRSSTLVYNSKPVGRLLAQTSDSSPVGSLAMPTTSIYHYTPGCTLKTGRRILGPTTQIRFGVNDTVSDAHRLRGSGAAPGYTLHIFFITLFGVTPSPCEGFIPQSVLPDQPLIQMRGVEGESPELEKKSPAPTGQEDNATTPK